MVELYKCTIKMSTFTLKLEAVTYNRLFLKDPQSAKILLLPLKYEIIMVTSNHSFYQKLFRILMVAVLEIRTVFRVDRGSESL